MKSDLVNWCWHGNGFLNRGTITEHLSLICISFNGNRPGNRFEAVKDEIRVEFVYFTAHCPIRYHIAWFSLGTQAEAKA